jgi:hypothetical protein
MQFKNEDFEKKAKQSMSTLDKLESKLQFKGAQKGAADLKVALDGIDTTKLANAIDIINYRFSTFGQIGTALINKVVGRLTGKLGQLFDIMNTKGESRARNLENARFQLRSLVTEAEGGEKAIADIMEVVNKSVTGTRFGLDEAAAIAGQLRSAGVKDLDTMQGYGPNHLQDDG